MAPDFPILGGKCGAQEQDLFFLFRAAELKGLSERGHGKDLHPGAEGPGDLIEAVAVPVGFDHGHDARLPGQLLNSLQIMPEGGMVDLHPSASWRVVGEALSGGRHPESMESDLLRGKLKSEKVEGLKGMQGSRGGVSYPVNFSTF